MREVFIRGPIDIGIEITSRCNLNCLYCYSKEHQNYSDMNTDSIKNLTIELMKVLRPFEITFEGGEPFLRGDIMDLIEWGVQNICQQEKLGFSVLSNGSTMKIDQIKEIANLQRYAPGLFTLQISLDTLNESINNKVRGAFSETIGTIENLIKYNVDFIIGIVVTSFNIDYIIKDIESFYALGVKRLLVMNMMPSLKLVNSGMFLKLKPPIEYLSKVFLEIENINKAKRGQFFIDSPYNCGQLDIEGRQSLDYKGCSAYILRMAIKTNGDVIPCSILRDWCLGNVFNQKITEIWKAEMWNNFRRRNKFLCYELYAPTF